MKKGTPKPFAVEDVRLSLCFTAPSYRIFMALLIGWVLTIGTHTITQVILTMRLHESRHFATIYRFLEKGRWRTDMISYCLFRMMVETLVSEGVEIRTVGDDTLNKHRGPKICGAGWQYDGSAPKRSKKAKQTSYGVCFVIIGLEIRLPEISDRVFCLPYAARLWWPKTAKVKPRSLPYKTKPELLLDLIHLTRSWLREGERLRVVTDSAYCCETVLKGRPKDVHITGRLIKRAALFCPVDVPGTPGRGRPRKKGDRLPTPAAMFKDPNLSWTEIMTFCYGKEVRLLVHQFTALWYHSAGEAPITVVLCRDPDGKDPDTVLFDTDLTASARDIVGRYAGRWSIEVTNRETKQLLGAADPQCRKENSVFRAPMFAYWSYSFVVLWFVQQFSTAKNLVAEPAPWYRHKKNITFSDMLAAARRSHFSIGISSKARTCKALPKIKQTRHTREIDHARIAKL